MNIKYITLFLLATSPAAFSQLSTAFEETTAVIEAASEAAEKAVAVAKETADGAAEAVDGAVEVVHGSVELVKELDVVKENGDAVGNLAPAEGDVASAPEDDGVPVLVKIIKSEDTETADEGIHLQVDQFPDEGAAKKGTQEPRITAPWPAKPDQNIPNGWKLVPAPESLNDYKISVNLEDGQTVHLTMTPFVLAPKKGGSVIAAVVEPGFDPVQFDQQEKTMGALLGSATIQLEQKEKQAAAVIDQLQQLLSSLPQ